MKNVMSVRLDSKTLRRLRELSNRENKEMSTVARELIAQGLELVTLREYREGKLSLGSVAKRLDVSLSEVIDLLAELGVRSPIEYDDYLKSYAAASEFLSEPR
jgi:predicted transcriptional regulator